MSGAEIYLDIDGVLNRWQIHEMNRRLHQTITERDWPLWLGWDIVSVYNHFQLGQPITPDEFWADVPESSWVEAPVSELFHLLINRSAGIVGENNVHIVTSVPRDRNPDAYRGKALWCAYHLPEWLQPQVYMVTHDKSRLARPGRLLVDDADHNILAWEHEGGQAIQVPRPWSSNYEIGQPENHAVAVVGAGLDAFERQVLAGA